MGIWHYWTRNRKEKVEYLNINFLFRRKILLGKRESWALKPGIQLKESGIGSSIKIPLTKTGIQYMESRVQDCLGSLINLHGARICFESAQKLKVKLSNIRSKTFKTSSFTITIHVFNARVRENSCSNCLNTLLQPLFHPVLLCPHYDIVCCEVFWIQDLSYF